MMRRRLPRAGPPCQIPPAIAARILLLREDAMVLDKPAGLAVHRGPRGGASLEDWLEALRMGKRHLPQPAHRLDADTAGCLVLGRTKPALAALGALFARGAAEKTYWAVVRGGPAGAEGSIALPLRKRSSAAQGWRMEAHPDGQAALTRWLLRGRAEGLAWLELRPETGRTHQLRVHCAAMGWPILGDALYGGGAEGGLHLLARAIALPLDPLLSATAPVPPHMRAALMACGWDGA
ncbi:RluA family pseudouridine synthase [Roseomonas alkaliterrae]|uniref:RluA family pseudouridine synthase n=2 Tax=Neoroseomonas alkaliterrae TaxID=1452450 RepID=A0A840Y3U5_9PROT|nr:RluA family pseudouridine synthase [Neoroseomonas alkaliterrae]